MLLSSQLQLLLLFLLLLLLCPAPLLQVFNCPRLYKCIFPGKNMGGVTPADTWARAMHRPEDTRAEVSLSKQHPVERLTHPPLFFPWNMNRPKANYFNCLKQLPCSKLSNKYE